MSAFTPLQEAVLRRIIREQIAQHRAMSGTGRLALIREHQDFLHPAEQAGGADV